MSYIDRVLADLKERYKDQPEFLQTAEEVLGTLRPIINQNPKYEEASLLERLVEPERVIIFRVPWVSLAFISPWMSQHQTHPPSEKDTLT